MEGVAGYRQHLYARMPINVVDRHFSQQWNPNRPEKGKMLGHEFHLYFIVLNAMIWPYHSKGYLLFFKIKVWRVEFNGRAKNGDGALLVLVAERLVVREAL